MSHQDNYNLITAIKQDNLALFSTLSKDNLNLRFGRFPILTLCYLYNAKKILRKFQKELWKVKDYITLNEPYEVYQKFRTAAGRTLRLFTNEKAIVSPIEMLAILHQDRLVKQLYRKHKHSLLDKVKRNLKNIYTIYNQEPYILTYKIKLKPKKLTKYERLPYKIGISFSLIFVTLLTAILLTLNFTTGLGTIDNPYKINTAKQLLSAVNSEANYILTKDIEIENSNIAEDFNCSLDGNGHTITIKSFPTTSLITNNIGTIKNLKIIYPNTTKTISTSLSLLVKNNNGTINNTHITCNEMNLTCNKTSYENIYINGIANKNSGVIDNCSVQFVCNLTTNGNGECFVSGIVGENTGNIINTTFLRNSSITTNEADASGITINNSKDGKITNSRNYANIHQTSEIDEWSPTVAGIVLTNYGSIENCTNTGELSITSNNANETAQGNIFIGGIVANNFGSITKGLNKGNITTSSKRLITYAGGIVAYSSYWIENNTTTYYPVLNNCGAIGTLNISSEHKNAFAFAGGIGGSYQYGEILDCFSLSDFTNIANTDKYFFGLLLGSSYLDIWFNNIYLSPSNNYVAYSDNVEYHIGSLINSNSIVSTEVNLNEGLLVTTEEQIKTQGVYFDE